MLPIQGGSGFLQGGWGGATTLQPQRSPLTLQNPGGGGARLNLSGSGGIPLYTAPARSSGTAGGTNGGTYSTNTGPSAAQVAATARATRDFGNLKTSTYHSIGDAVNAARTGFGGSIQDYLDARKQNQNSINNESVQNELSRQQGMQGVLDMVGNGVRSGGVILANANAGSSSAGEALARAYGVEGRQQASQVGNQAAQGANQIATEQGNLALGDTTELRHAKEDKTSTINSIVNNARSQLGSLNQMAAYASIPDRVNIEAKINSVKQQALSALSAYDKVLTGGIAANTPQGADATRAKASQLLTAGVAPENAFSYTTTPPPQLQGTGPSPSTLPIYTAGRKRTG